MIQNDQPFLPCVREDIREVERRYGKRAAVTVLTNRGFHALLAYRLSKLLRRVPLVPMVLTRLTQIVYGIDIDPDASIAGGMVIIHGVGVVIGHGAVVGPRVLVYHGVTLGMKCSGHDDGFPTIGPDCSIGAGAKLLGPITVGAGSVIGANVVLTQSLEAGSVAKVQPPVVRVRRPTAVPANAGRA